MGGEEFDRFRPQGGHGVWGIEEVDVEPVGLVVVVHVVEHIVVDVAEEFDFGFHAPVVPVLFEVRVEKEEAAVPSAHLMIGYFVGVLYIVLFEDLDGLVKDVHGNPVRGGPVLFWDDVVGTGGFCHGLSLFFEFFGEGDIVHEGPRIVEFGVPGSFKVAHGGEEVFEFAIPYEGEESGVYPGGVWV